MLWILVIRSHKVSILLNTQRKLNLLRYSFSVDPNTNLIHAHSVVSKMRNATQFDRNSFIVCFSLTIKKVVREPQIAKYSNCATSELLLDTHTHTHTHTHTNTNTHTLDSVRHGRGHGQKIHLQMTQMRVFASYQQQYNHPQTSLHFYLPVWASR